MRGLLLEPFSGISGDMFIGALLDLGLDFEDLRAALATIPLESFQLTREQTMRGALRATKFDVIVRLADGRLVREARPVDDAEAKRAAFRGGFGHGHDHTHGHDHGHPHDHGHGHDHAHGPDHGHAHESGGEAHDPHRHHHAHAPLHPAEKKGGAIESGVFGGHHAHVHGKSYAEIRAIIAQSGLSPRVKDLADRIFTILATAEAKVHGIPVDTVHFHEVGAVDSIIDVCGAAFGLERLGIEEVVSTAVTIGVGTAPMAHGRLPLPAPAAAEILCGMPLIRSTVTDELVTPTGAAILRAVVDAFDRPMTVRPLAIGYGAGSTPRADPPNVLRATLYERDAAAAPAADSVVLLETQVDDMTGEAIGFLRARLESLGALDVTIIPAMMKKNRPGHLIGVISRPTDAAALTEALLVESSTFGVRRTVAERAVLDREIVRVETAFGPLRVKVGRIGTRVVKVSAEYEDCAAVARERGVSLDLVMSAAVLAYSSRRAE